MEDKFTYPEVGNDPKFTGLLGSAGILTAEDGRKFIVQTWEGIVTNKSYPTVNVSMTPVSEKKD